MALSDWDAIAFDDEAICCLGWFASPKGEALQIRKNRLWLHTEDGKVETKEVRDRLTTFNLGDMQIYASLGPQDAVYVYAVGDGKRFAGLGCRSYDLVGVRAATLTSFIEWLRSLDSDQDFGRWVDKIASAEHLRFNQGDAYIAQKLGKDVPATAIGEAETPLLLQVIESRDSSVGRAADS